MKRKIKIVYIILIATGWISCNQKSTDEKKDDLKGTITLSGAFALYPLAVKWGEEFHKINPAVKIDVQAGGAGKGMADALSGMIDMGMVSREISSEETKKGAFGIAVTKDAVVPTINPKNPFYNDLIKQGITKEQFMDIFVTGKIKTWEELLNKKGNTPIHAFTRSDASGAAEVWAKYLGKKQEDLQGTGVFGDAGIADAIKNDPNAIGYNNIGFSYDAKTKKPFEGLLALPIDLNKDGKIDETENFYSTVDNLDKAIVEGKYPSPPARDLYFVSKGKPERKEVIAFLKWVLTDGQKYVADAGYINIPDDKLKEGIEKIGNKK
ncbi:MAG: substrate-binding domain-containing protein [Bacteroidota bacterium]